MADRRNNLRAVKAEINKDDYRDKIRRHRLTAVYRVILVMVTVLILVAIVYVQYRNHVYTSYDLEATVNFDRVPDSEIKRLGDNILTYSHDGAHCTNPKGEVLWNQTLSKENKAIRHFCLYLYAADDQAYFY